MKHSMRSIFAATFYLAVFICGITGILLLLDWDTHAYSACQLDLPPGQVTMAVDVNEYKACDQLPGFTGYFDATLSNVPSGYSLGNSTYPGFCADLGGYILDNPMFGNVTYQIQLLSSIDNPAFRDRPWDKINYILTHYPIPGNSWLDVQAAVWTLIDGCAPQSDPTLFDCQPHRAAPYYFPFGGTGSPYGCPPDGKVDKAKVGQIIADANANGSGFTPGNGNRFAVIINPESCTGSNSSYNSYCSDPNHTPYQLLFTTATCVANYTITASADAGGSISPSGAVTVNHGSDQSFTVTPNPNYHVADVLVDGSSAGALTSYPFNNVTADHTISTSFAIDTHTVTSSQGANGTINPLTTQTVTHNATTSFTVTPAPGYLTVMSGTCGGALVGNTYTTNPVTADCTVDASFTITTNTIQASAGAHGGISPSGAVTVTYGANQPFTVTPDANYQVSDVLVDGIAVGAVTSYPFNNVITNHTISASFVVLAPLAITTQSLPSGLLLNSYSQTLTATGGMLPYKWSVSSGALPGGLTLNSSTGEISGTPTTSGTFSFTVQVMDAVPSAAFTNLSITIGSLPVRFGNPNAPINYDQVIQSAYDQCTEGYVIQVQALEFPANDIWFDRPVTITLQGGFDAAFTGNLSFTTITGKLVISDGTIIVENIVIK